MLRGWEVLTIYLSPTSFEIQIPGVKYFNRRIPSIPFPFQFHPKHFRYSVTLTQHHHAPSPTMPIKVLTLHMPSYRGPSPSPTTHPTSNPTPPRTHPRDAQSGNPPNAYA